MAHLDNIPSSLIEYGNDDPLVKQGVSPQWENQWQSGIKQGQAFDNNGATKALDALLTKRAGVSVAGKTALVPGCGRGYDVARFAVAGYTATGVELAPSAIEEAKAYIASLQSDDPLFKAKDNTLVNFEAGNFFEYGQESTFDIVYDCTFLCALHPDMRTKWASHIRKLLKPGGELITLIFPICDKLGGPPFAMSVDLVTNLLTAEKFSLVEMQNPLPPDLKHLMVAPFGSALAVWRKEN
eukprot:m.74903 g.74903  ORF g.74903 m.74903 type:complete len:240 (-) comp24713_c0_seq2:207-926(-)